MPMYSPRKGEDGELHLSEKQEAFLEFLLTPGPERPCSQNEWARQTHTDPKTLIRWKKDIVFRQEWEKRLKAMNVSPESTQPIIETLRQKAIKGDVKAAELYLKYVAQISPPQVLQVENKKAEDLSDDELAEHARGFLRVVGEE